MHSWIFQDNSIQKHFICGAISNLTAATKLSFPSHKNTKTLKKQTSSFHVFFLQICFPPANLVEPCRTFRRLRSQDEGLFPFPVFKVSTSMARKRTPLASFFPAAAENPGKSSRSQEEETQHSKREQPQHFYILDEITFLFLGWKIANSDKKEDGIVDFRAGFYFF